MLGYAASLHVYPHLTDEEGLLLRHGSGTEIRVPWDAVDSIGVRERGLERSKAVQVDDSEDATVLSVVIASRTNVDLVLRGPLSVPQAQRAVDEIRFFTDDPRALTARVKALRSS